MVGNNAIDDLDYVMEVAAVRRRENCHSNQHRCLFRQRINPAYYYSEQEFLARFRLSKEAFDALLLEIRHLLPTSRDRRDKTML